MRRTEGLEKALEAANKNGTSFNEWVMLLLTDIAYSLAVIADKMTEGERDESD